MMSRYNVWLDGVALSSLHPQIYVSDIQYETPNINTSVMPIAKRAGALVTNRTQEKTTVTVLFELRIQGTAERQAACENITRWAMQGKILETSDRTMKRLHIICAAPPAIDSAMRWLNQLRIIFEAYTPPYWEDKTESTLTISGTSASGTLYVPGNAGLALVNAVVTPSATITSLSLTAGDYTISLSDISVTSSQTVKVAHDDNLFLSIKRGSTSLLNKRTGADDLLVECGKTSTFSMTASASSSVTFKVRGLWL